MSLWQFTFIASAHFPVIMLHCHCDTFFKTQCEGPQKGKKLDLRVKVIYSQNQGSLYQSKYMPTYSIQSHPLETLVEVDVDLHLHLVA